METMTVTPISWPEERDGGYQHHESRSSTVVLLNRANSTRSHRRMVSEPVIETQARCQVSDEYSQSQWRLWFQKDEAELKSFDTPRTISKLSDISIDRTGNEKNQMSFIGETPTEVFPNASADLVGMPRVFKSETSVVRKRSKAHDSPTPDSLLCPSSIISRAEAATIIEGPDLLHPTQHVRHPIIDLPSLPSDPPHRFQPPSPWSSRHGLSSFEKDRDKVKRLRQEVWGLRSRGQVMRQELKEKRLAIASADDKYLQFFRIHGAASFSPLRAMAVPEATLAALRQECQRARDEYGPLEDEFSLLESYLGTKEFELQRMEETFYDKQLNLSTAYPAVEGGGDSSRETSSRSSRFSGSEFGIQGHPLLNQYYEKLGDVQIMRERLGDLVEQKYILEDEQLTRQRVGRELAEDDQEWLQKYPKVEDEMINQFDAAEMEADRLRRDCLLLGVITEDGSPTDYAAQEHHIFNDDLDAGSETSEYIKYSHLIPRPGIKKAPKNLSFRNEGGDYDEGSDASNERINNWLLFRLRTSALEVQLLADIFEAICGKIEHGGKWQVDVLQFWSDEPTAAGNVKIRDLSTISKSTTVPRSPTVSKPQLDQEIRKAWGPAHPKLFSSTREAWFRPERNRKTLQRAAAIAFAKTTNVSEKLLISARRSSA